jgi:hypothetical protein
MSEAEQGTLRCLKDRFTIEKSALDSAAAVMAKMEANCYHTSNAPGGYYQAICDRCHSCPVNAKLREAWLAHR